MTNELTENQVTELLGFDMAKISISCLVNARVAIWIHYLALQENVPPSKYMEQVLLRHLETLPEVDLSQSPYSQPKGVSNGK